LIASRFSGPLGLRRSAGSSLIAAPFLVIVMLRSVAYGLAAAIPLSGPEGRQRALEGLPANDEWKGGSMDGEARVTAVSQLNRFGALSIARSAAVWGPGIVVMLADTDAGNVVTASQSGALWGYRLLPLVLLLIPMLYRFRS
jgi:hypothetical protein